MVYGEGYVVKYLYSVDGLGNSFYEQHVISDFTGWTEVNVRIFAAGRTNLIQLDFLKGTFTGSSLL